MLVFYIGGVNKLDRLATSPLGSVAESLPWALLLLPKHRLSCPLVLGRRRDIDGGWNPGCWTVWCVVRTLSCIVCCMGGGGCPISNLFRRSYNACTFPSAAVARSA